MDRKIVTEIPANPMLANLQHRKRKLRVAAYCRVSTEEEEQQNSFEVQVDYYTEKISNHEGWQLAGIFADDGISGVRTKKREQFNKMIELCKQKKIDLILTNPSPDLPETPLIVSSTSESSKAGGSLLYLKKKTSILQT